MYDINENGFLSKEELLLWLRDSLGDFGKCAEGDDDIRVKCFKSYGLAAGWTLSLIWHETLSLTITNNSLFQELVDLTFRRSDVDGDGYISELDYLSVTARDPLWCDEWLIYKLSL